MQADLAHSFADHYNSGPSTQFVAQGGLLNPVTQRAFVVESDHAPVQELSREQRASRLAWGADLAVIIVDSAVGIDNPTIESALHAIARVPTVVVITGLDGDNSSFDDTLAVAQRVFGSDRSVIAVTLPIIDDAEKVGGVLDLISQDMWWHGDPDPHPLEDQHWALIEGRIDEISQGVIVTTHSDDIAAELIEGAELDSEVIAQEIVNATADLEMIPVFAVENRIGLDHLRTFISALIDDLKPIELLLETSMASYFAPCYLRVWSGEFTRGNVFTDMENPARIKRITSLANGEVHTATPQGLYRVVFETPLASGTTVSNEPHPDISVLLAE